MKLQFALLKLVCAAVLASSAGFALAQNAQTQTLTPTATVSPTCKFSAGNTPLAFGAIDPSSTLDKTTTASVLYKCTKGTNATGVTVAGTLTRTMNTATVLDPLNYLLALSGGTQLGQGFGSGKDLTLTVTGTITAVQFQNVAAGTYSDNVTLNITP